MDGGGRDEEGGVSWQSTLLLLNLLCYAVIRDVSLRQRFCVVAGLPDGRRRRVVGR